MTSLVSSLRGSPRNSLSSPPPPMIDHRIILRDNTATPSPPERTSSTAGNTITTAGTTPEGSLHENHHHQHSSRGSAGKLGGSLQNGGSSSTNGAEKVGKVDTLRKALAQRKYSKWNGDAAGGVGVGVTDGSAAAVFNEQLADPGVVVNKKRVGGGTGGTGMGGEEELDREEAVDWDLRQQKGKDVGGEGGHGVLLEIEDEPETTVGKGGLAERESLEPLRPEMAQAEYPGDADGDVESSNGIIPEGETWVGVRAMQRAKRRQQETRDADIDVLYENQRGLFMCGIPLFSAKSLLNFDPSPWQTREFKNSSCSILTQQCPDPSWEWVWKTWYVDMTTDVDDQGWSYSFSFNPFFSWHGNHVWFHSFVRRRRWLRKRVKANRTRNDGSPEEIETGHGMNADYFTIHSRAKNKRASGVSQEGYSWNAMRKSASVGGAGWGAKNDPPALEGRHVDLNGELVDEVEEITDIPTLMKVLRSCRLDREKIWAMEKFMREGGEEVAYLAEKMNALMALLIFQASRRYFLRYLSSTLAKAEREFENKYGQPPVELPLSPIVSQATHPTSPSISGAEAASQLDSSSPSPSTRPISPLVPDLESFTTPRECSPTRSNNCPPPSHSQTQKSLSDEENNPPDTPSSKDLSRITALRRAVAAADEEVTRLEFWSDIREVVKNGESAGGEGRWGKGWNGLDGSGPEEVGKRDSDSDMGVGVGIGGERDKGKGKGKEREV